MNKQNHVLGELQRLGRKSGEEGILFVFEGHYNGVIYIKNGYVRHCHAANNYGASETGFHSLLRILSLKSPEWCWESCDLPQDKSMKISIDSVLDSVDELTIKRSQQTKTARLQLPNKQQIDLSKGKVYVHVDKGGLEGKKYVLLPGKTTVGRAPGCHIRLPDSTVSTRHCHFMIKDNTVFLEDLDSFNGTLINGVSINKYAVALNDVIEIGEVMTHLSYQENDAEMENDDIINDLDTDDMDGFEEAFGTAEPESRTSLQKKLRQITRVVEKKFKNRDKQNKEEIANEESLHESDVELEEASENSDSSEAQCPNRMALQRELRQKTKVVQKTAEYCDK
ncbi:MAG: FHA domain-containing protein [Verrucomicrobiota bacterium]